MISRQWYIVTGVAILIIVLLLLISVPTVVLSEQNGTIRLLVPLWQEKEFTVEYMHSVNKTPVQENFIPAPDNKIKLTGTEFRSLGVGTPFLPEEGQLVNDQGVYHLSGIERYFDRVPFIFLPFTRHTLIAGGERFAFSDYFAAGQIVEVRMERYTLIHLIQYHIKKGSSL